MISSRSTLPHELERYRRRVSVEAPYELRRHPEPSRLTLLAAYAHLRSRELTDDLVDLLIETIHQIGARAERKVDRALLEDLKRACGGKPSILFEIAAATLEQPDGVVRDVVFPVADEQTLRDLVREGKATIEYRKTLRTVIRNSYKGHYRRMVPEILQTLDFRSNNQRHRPVMQALDLLRALRRHDHARVPGRRRGAAGGHRFRPLARSRHRERRQGAAPHQPHHL